MGACYSTDSDLELKEELRARVDLSGINLVDYTARVKQYTDMRNNGRISVDQLSVSFRDTDIFKHITNPNSVCNRLILSPFFKEFTLSHNEGIEMQANDDNEIELTKQDIVNQSIRSSKQSPKFACEDVLDNRDTF